jgi:hypothetical protein
VVAWGDNTWGQCNVPAGLSNVVAIAAGAGHTLALRADGTVVAWGSNLDLQGIYVGQAVVPKGLSNVMAIAAGAAHSVALRRNGTLIGWGSSAEGQLNAPANLSARAIAAGASHTLALKADGSCAAWGANWEGQCQVLSGLTNVVGVAGGQAHTLLLLGERPMAPRMVWANREQGTFSILAQTLPGQFCTLEYKDGLNAPEWLPLNTLPTGGANQFFIDPTANTPQRLYRLKQW